MFSLDPTPCWASWPLIRDSNRPAIEDARALVQPGVRANTEGVPAHHDTILRPETDPDALGVGARLLGEGALVLLPTETVYAIGVRADDSAAMERLWHARSDASPSALAWHAPTVDRLREAVTIDSPMHTRILSRLLPGPVQLAIELSPQALDLVRERLGVLSGVIDDGEHLLVRVSSHPCVTGLLGLCDFPVVMAGAASGRATRTIEDAIGEDASRLGAILDAGPPPAGMGSTLIRLTRDGRYHVARPGLLQERTITRTMSRTILFVCSGNTCRSPMASAIARHLLADREDGLDSRIFSAGTSTGPGAPASPEAVEAVRSMGIALDSHASRPLTRELLAQADIIFAMTGVHRDRIVQIDPESAEKVHLLDPEESDIPDPYGQPQSVYNATAHRLEELIRVRLNQLDALDPKERRS